VTDDAREIDGEIPAPARCPWCGKPTVRALPGIAPRTTRYFTCDGCRRTFAVDVVVAPLPPKEP
jgi:hypothetical protein